MSSLSGDENSELVEKQPGISLEIHANCEKRCHEGHSWHRIATEKWRIGLKKPSPASASARCRAA